MSLGMRSAWRWRIRCRCISAPRPLPGLGVVSRFSIAEIPRSTLRFNSTTSHSSEPPGVETPREDASQAPPRGYVHANLKRNSAFREAFLQAGPKIEKAVEAKLASPYVPAPRDYPDETATAKSLSAARRLARTQVGYDMLEQGFRYKVSDDWATILALMVVMTPKRSDETSMTALRVVLPKSWDLDVSDNQVQYVESATGVARRLRLSPVQQNPSAILLRGRSEVLAKAADEIVAACPDVEVFKLGRLEGVDYQSKRLWPVIEGAADGGSTLPPDKLESIWIHKEPQAYWIDLPYEIANKRRGSWTRERFASYIDGLVYGRLRSDLAYPFYKSIFHDLGSLDTDGMRVKYIMEAFEDPTARVHVTPSALKTAVSFMAHRGGHRAAADRLIKNAQSWGIPMDTELFNVMLHGYVVKYDARRFHTTLKKMWSSYFHANINTWLLLLQLLQKDEMRRQVFVHMYQLDLFDNAATRRGAAPIMASHDAYMALRSKRTLQSLIEAQGTRYGDGWFTNATRLAILDEVLKFRDNSRQAWSQQLEDVQLLIDKPSDYGKRADITSVNLILDHAATAKNWDMAVWTLRQMHWCDCEPDQTTYDHLVRLAIDTDSPQTLAAVFIYGVLGRKFQGPTRRRLRKALLGKHPFFKVHKPAILSNAMAHVLRDNPAHKAPRVVSALEKVILSLYEVYRPVVSLPDTLAHTVAGGDAELHELLGAEPSDAKRRYKRYPLTLKLRSISDPAREEDACFDECFDPQTMMRSDLPPGTPLQTAMAADGGQVDAA